MKNPLYQLLDGSAMQWELREEYEALRPSRRRKLLTRMARRELLLFLTLQWPLRRERLPAGTKKILWLYNWPTLGDSITDLSQRYYFPDDVQLDLCMPHGPVELWRGDDRFGKVYTAAEQCPRDYDFIILQDINSYTIKFKLSRFFSKPFFSVMEHQQGERFSRIDLGRYRLAGLLGHAPAKCYPPRLHLRDEKGERNTEEFQVALLLGGQDGRRIYDKWHDVVSACLFRWPSYLPKPRFLLLGRGPSAAENLDAFAPRLLDDACLSYVDASTLFETAQLIQGAEMFLGADGGLMHVAAALQIPGMALFSDIRPEWRLHPQSSIQAFYFDEPLSCIPAEWIAEKFISLLSKPLRLRR